MAFVQNGEVRLAVQQLGRGPDVVLLHGLATNRAFWYASHAQDLVAAGYRVTLFDLRGHGYSDQPDSGYSAVAMAEDLRAVVQQLSLQQPILIGHSYGGGVALEFAAQYPSQVGALALLDTRVNSLQPEQWLHEGPELTPFEQAVLDAAPADWDQETQVGLRYLESLARLTVSGASLPSMGVWTPFAEGRGGRRTASHFVRLLDRTRAQTEFLQPGATPACLRRALAGTPLLLLYAAASRCQASQKALSDLAPHAHCLQVAESGHFFPATHRQACAQALGRWLSSLPQAIRAAAVVAAQSAEALVE